MTQYFTENGEVIPVTVVQATPMVVTQIKTAAGKDKYNAIQVGTGRKNKVSKEDQKVLTSLLQKWLNNKGA